MTAPPATTTYRGPRTPIFKSKFPASIASIRSVSSISLPTIASAPDSRQLEHPPVYAPRLSSLRAVLRSKFRRSKPGAVLKESVLGPAPADTDKHTQNSLAITVDSKLVYYVHLPAPGMRHMKHGVVNDMHFHADSVSGHVVGALDMSRKEFCTENPAHKDVS